MINQIIILTVLIIFSGIFSSAEIAIFALSDLKIKHLVDLNIKNAKLLEKLKKDSHKLLITILIGNNLVNISAASIATAIAINTFGNAGIGIATGIMTLIILIFGEIIPKSFATRKAKNIALFMATPLNIFMKLMYPLVWVFDKFTIVVIPETNGEELNQITELEVRGMVNLSKEQGSINKNEQEMIENIFELDDTVSEDIMTARPDVVAIEKNTTVEEAKKLIKTSGFSRIPVYNEDLDNVIGILYAKDLLEVKDNYSIERFTRSVFFIPETKKIDSLLREFKQQKTHLAVVVNEHGTVVGIITIEDLIEEIVGEIYDETDHVDDDTNIKKIKRDTYLVKGKTELDELEEIIGFDIDEDSESTTLSGFLMEKLERIPKKGETLSFKKCNFIVESVKNNRVEKIKIVVNKSTE